MMMMKKKIIFIVATLLMSVGLIGCTSDREKERMENQISQLEQQVESLQGNTEMKTSSPEGVNTSSGALSADDRYGLEAIKQDVEKIVNQAENAVVVGEMNLRMESYFNLKAELERQEGVIDRVEDQMELDFRNQLISYDEYRNYEYVKDQLEDRLDQAEDRLEFTFGIDD